MRCIISSWMVRLHIFLLRLPTASLQMHTHVNELTLNPLTIGIDATLGTPILVGGQYLRVAYGYIGTTALANQGYSPAIAANPDSCVMFALGCYLLGNDWSLNRAWPLQPPLPDLSVVGDQTMRRRRRREQTSARRERQHSRRDGITNWRETNRRRGLREIFAERGNSDAHNHTHRGTH